MATSEEINDAIAENAMGPASVSVDGTSVNALDISKQIEAARYLKAQEAADKNHFGLRFVRMVTRRVN